MRSFAGGDGDVRQVMLGADFSALLLKGVDANFRFGRPPKTRKTMRPAFANAWISALMRRELRMRTKRNPGRKETHSFTLILSELSRLTDKLENTLFEAGCSDALLGTQDGRVYLDFDREAPSFAEAVSTAIRDVNKAGYQVARIEPDEELEAACPKPRNEK